MRLIRLIRPPERAAPEALAISSTSWPPAACLPCSGCWWGRARAAARDRQPGRRRLGRRRPRSDRGSTTTVGLGSWPWPRPSRPVVVVEQLGLAEALDPAAVRPEHHFAVDQPVGGEDALMSVPSSEPNCRRPFARWLAHVQIAKGRDLADDQQRRPVQSPPPRPGSGQAWSARRRSSGQAGVLHHQRRESRPRGRRRSAARRSAGAVDTPM